MNQSVFGKVYADQYDLLYGDKDYEAECNLIEQVFQRDAKDPVKSILDLGCGTGKNAIPLARRGYQVTGVDLSADMLEHARQKANLLVDSSSKSPAFFRGDVRSIDLGQHFDAVLMMFAVLGYQLTNHDVLSTLQTVRRHLKPNGLFIFDVWYGPAVLAIRLSDRVKVIPTQDGKLIRIASGTLDINSQLTEVNYHVLKISGDKLVSEIDEVHKMRYFFQQELEMALNQSGLFLRTLTAFPNLTKPADETTWNTLIVASQEK